MLDTTSNCPDVTSEILAGSGVSLGHAAEKFPAYRDSKKSTKVNPSTVFRWVTVGIRLPNGQRLRLEAARIGGRYLTTPQAIERFLRAQTPVAEPAPAPKSRGRRAQQALDELAEAGI